jgi:Na+-driven multidrug efflux pump
MLLEMLAAYAVGLFAVAWAARLGAAHAAAFTVATTVHSAVFLLFRVVAAGATVAVAQCLGAKDVVGVRQLSQASLAASIALGVAGGACIALGAQLWVAWVKPDATVAPLTTEVLWHLAPALALDAVLACVAAVARAHFANRTVLAWSLGMHLLHLGLAAWLMPRYGLPGFAWAMLASRVLACAGLAWVWRTRLQLFLPAPAWSLGILRPVLRIGFPALIEGLLYRVAVLVAVAAVVRLGTQDTAAHGYVNQATHVWVMFTFALGLSCEIVVGHAVGAGHAAKVRAVVARSLKWGVAIAVVGPALLAASQSVWLPWLAPDPAAWSLLFPLLWIAVLLEVGRTCNIVLINALRAAGDVHFPVLIAGISMSTVLAGGAWLLGLGMGWGLVGVWAALAADECARGLAMAWRFYSGRWEQRLERPVIKASDTVDIGATA